MKFEQLLPPLVLHEPSPRHAPEATLTGVSFELSAPVDIHIHRVT